MCFSSSDRSAAPAPRPIQVGPPQDHILHIPRPRLDARGVPLVIEDHELNRQTIEYGLTLMAHYLHQRNENITVIAIGGAVNTLFLGSRETTHDVDFLGTNMDNRQRVLLDEAAQHAESNSPVPLGGEWFNSHTMMWLSPPIHRSLTEAALVQNDVVFERPGLKLVAAPWSYALLAKMDRLSKATARSYDLSDAVVYLNRYIETHGRQPIPFTLVRQWAEQFQLQVRPEIVRTVSTEYQRRYNRIGITR